MIVEHFDPFAAAKRAFENTINKMKEGIRKTIGAAIDRIKKIFTEATDAIRNGVNKVGKAILDEVKNLPRRILILVESVGRRVLTFLTKTLGGLLMSACKLIFPEKIEPIVLKPESNEPTKPILGCIDISNYKKIVMGSDYKEKEREGQEKAVEALNNFNQLRSSLSNVCNIIANVVNYIVKMIKMIFSREDYEVFRKIKYSCDIPPIPIGNLRIPDKVNWSCRIRV